MQVRRGPGEPWAGHRREREQEADHQHPRHRGPGVYREQGPGRHGNPAGTERPDSDGGALVPGAGNAGQARRHHRCEQRVRGGDGIVQAVQAGVEGGDGCERDQAARRPAQAAVR
ncbi:hypothetical protein ACWD6R_34760 [Streptomyces sp. NPDC005151]